MPPTVMKCRKHRVSKLYEYCQSSYKIKGFSSVAKQKLFKKGNQRIRHILTTFTMRTINQIIEIGNIKMKK